MNDGTRDLARNQRSQLTLAEQALWRAPRGRRLYRRKFRRQVPIGPYVADFVSFESRLIVELDGPPHHDPPALVHDQRRDAWLRHQGSEVLRFPNDLLLGGSTDLVVERILRAISGREVPSSDLR